MQDTNILDEQPIAWRPTPEVIERAQLTKFMKQVGVSTWNELYEFSIRDVEKFTEEVLKFLDIRFDPPYEKILDISNGIELPQWLARNADTLVRHENERNADTPVRNEGERNADTPVRNEGEARTTAATFENKKDWHFSSASSQAAIADKSVRVPAAGLNITEMCLDRWQTDEMRDRPAIIWEGESGKEETYSYAEMHRYVEQVAESLKRAGFKKGDAIGIHLPMIPETVNVLLSINRIGAIAVPVFSGYGVDAIASRLNAVGAKALFTAENFSRRGKSVDSLKTAIEAVSNCPTIEKVYVTSCNSEELDLRRRTDDPRFSSFYELFDPAEFALPEPTSAEDPLIILYTSGTTGKPKGIAHTHASFPIKAAQDMAFGTDVGKGTRISWYTDIGWMMGPWLIYGALINGATICIYDGAPDYPTPDRMWEFCAKHKVEVLGISPTLIRSLAASEDAQTSKISSRSPSSKGGVAERSEDAQTNEISSGSPPYKGGVDERSEDGVVLSSDKNSEAVNPRSDNHPVAEAATPILRKEGCYNAPFERHDLSALRVFASTGEPWNPAPWWWLFEKVGNGKLPIINYSGGTEISGGILMGNPLLPIKPCSFPAPCLGMDVDILDENGNSVPDGTVGELVIKQPWIGMARGFWQEKERYFEAYWRRFKNIWVHGDWAMRDRDGHWFILGRSDDTLKVAGKRVGPAEVESLLVAHPLVVEAAVIGVPDEVKGTAMVAFVVHNADTPVRTNYVPLEQELKALVAKDMGKPLAPSKIHFVSALPKTRNAKVMRRVIRAAYLGQDPGDLSALEDPKVVEEIASAKLNAL